MDETDFKYKLNNIINEYGLKPEPENKYKKKEKKEYKLNHLKGWYDTVKAVEKEVPKGTNRREILKIASEIYNN